MQPLNTMQNKAFGVLLLGDGGDRDWKDGLAAMFKKLAPEFPLEFAAGQADVKAIQKAVDRLAADRIKKLVVVPLYTTSDSPLMDETRFLFGIRKDPSTAFFAASRTHSGYAMVRRVETKLPVVLTPALDDNPLVVEVLTSRALSLSKKPENEAVVLVGLAPPAPPADEEHSVLPPGSKPSAPEEEFQQTLSAMVEKIRAKGGFRVGQAAVLQPEALRQSDRQRHDEELRKLVRGLGSTRHVLVIPYAVTGELASYHILRALQGTFMRYSSKGLLPDDRMVRWVEETAKRGAALPDMRAYKEAGRALSSFSKATHLKSQGDYGR